MCTTSSKNLQSRCRYGILESIATQNPSRNSPPRMLLLRAG